MISCQFQHAYILEIQVSMGLDWKYWEGFELTQEFQEVIESRKDILITLFEQTSWDWVYFNGLVLFSKVWFWSSSRYLRSYDCHNFPDLEVEKDAERFPEFVAKSPGNCEATIMGFARVLVCQIGSHQLRCWKFRSNSLQQHAFFFMPKSIWISSTHMTYDLFLQVHRLVSYH